MIAQDTRLRLAGIGVLLPLIIAVILGDETAKIAIILICGLLIYELCLLLGKTLNQRLIIALLIYLAPALYAVSDTLLFGLVALGASGLFLSRLMSALSAFYAASVSLCIMAFVYVMGIGGMSTDLIALACIIAAVDSGAYIVGRRFGGPKLAPRISPKKTISGAVGGTLFGVSAGLILALIFNTSLLFSLFLTLSVSVVSQMGDLVESAFKRQMNVKDSSNLIPGHGGFLDRFDGYIYVIPLLAVLHMVMGTRL